MRYWKCHLLAVACIGVLIASCRNGTAPYAASKAPATTQSSAAPLQAPRHWVQDQQLRAVMAELSLHTRESWPQGLPDNPEEADRPREQAFREAATLADGLAAAAGRIPASVQKRPMSAEDRRGFYAEANRLRDSSLELKVAAGGRRIEPMQRALDQINSSCIACHSRYRDFTGELDSRRASAGGQTGGWLASNR